MAEPTPEPKESAAIVVRPTEPPAIVVQSVEPPLIIVRPVERAGVAEPTHARKTFATLVVVALVCTVWWIIEQRSKPPPAPLPKLPYPPVVAPAK